jgi:steroid 5-alpha reductase family enzyme
MNRAAVAAGRGQGRDQARRSRPAAVLAALIITFVVALAAGRHSVADIAGGLGFALVAAVALAMSAGHGDAGRRILLAVSTVAWGVRLAAHIARRSRGAGEDPRYAKMPAKAPGSPADLRLDRGHRWQECLNDCRASAVTAPCPAYQAKAAHGPS